MSAPPLLGSRFEVVARRRPVTLGVPLTGPLLAPYAAIETPLPSGLVQGTAELVLASGSTLLRGHWDGSAVRLTVTHEGRTTRHRSRRHSRPDGPVETLGLTLTGTHLTAFTRAGGAWTARGRVDLADRVDTHDEGWLAGLTAPGGPPLAGFGQLGLRDLRLVGHADGTAYRPAGPGEELLLSATSAGPGFFDTAHTSVWALDPGTLTLAHRADLFFRRPDRPGVFGDHATHLVRDGDRWLVATSTWGDFDRRRPVRVTLAEVPATTDLTTGRHVLDTRELPLPTDGLRSVAVWDPHLVRTDDGWLVGFVTARRYFRFHPALAAGPGLDDLALRAADPTPRECEGTTLVHADGGWRVLASDRHRQAFTVHDLDLAPLGRLDAPYPSNIPWPTLVPVDGGWLLVAFDGTRCAGPLPGYGTHGDVVLLRSDAH